MLIFVINRKIIHYEQTMIATIITFIFIAFAFIAIACFFWMKLFRLLFRKPGPAPPKVFSNPYIEAHKIKVRNDDNYNIYLQWLLKNGSGVPFNKVQTPEEIEAAKKINNLMK